MFLNGAGIQHWQIRPVYEGFYGVTALLRCP